MFNTINVIHTVLQNIIKQPNEIKYRRLRLSNKFIKTAITDVTQSRFLLEMLGFQEIELPVNDVIFADGSNVREPFFVLEGSQSFDLRSLKMVCEIIEKMVKDNDMGSLATKASDLTLK